MMNLKATLFPVGLVLIAAFLLLASCQSTDGNGQPETGNEIIVDVRTVEEWNAGHATCTINIPLDELPNRLDELRGYDKVIVVCASGKRAGNAENLLRQNGFSNVENRGAWTSVTCPDNL